MATTAQSSAQGAKKPAVATPKAPTRRSISASHREQIAELTAKGYTLKVIAGLIGFDLATVKRHVSRMRAIGDLPPSTRATRKLPPKKHCTAPRLLPEDVQELRGIIMGLELKVQSLQTPARPCPPEWQHVVAEWDRLERLRQQTGAALPTCHRPLGFVESTLRKNHPKES